TLVSMSGSGWSCASNACSRSDVLAAAGSYPAITVTVNVLPNATSPQNNQVSVSGGGSATASVGDSTVITGGLTPTNLAQGKSATQSSTASQYGPAGASLAVDGNTNGDFSAGSVSHTNNESTPWWQVDLASSASINSITIWNRTDCCSDR